MQRIVVLLSVVSIGVAACDRGEVEDAPPAPAPAARPVRIVENPASDDVREATLRYLFLHNGSGAQQHAGVYCIDLDDHDPPAAFVARFADVAPPVKAASACKTGEYGEVLDRATGKRGIGFHLGEISWPGDGRVYIDASYVEGSVDAGGYVCAVERRDGVWVVAGARGTWVSAGERLREAPARDPRYGRLTGRALRGAVETQRFSTRDGLSRQA
jgi:hypothetical protein